MSSLETVNAPAAEFAHGTGITLWDLAYQEWCDRDLYGAPNAHVEAYFAHLALREAPPAIKINPAGPRIDDWTPIISPDGYVKLDVLATRDRPR